MGIAEEVGADLTTDFRPGEHEWGFWDAEIRTVLDWIGTGRSALPSDSPGR